jgi:methionyl-tRNA formyltransferase
MTRSEKVLFLGPKEAPLLRWLKQSEKDIDNTSKPINLNYLQHLNIGFLISYGYRHILKKDVLDNFKNKAINLHISYLPWNKGSDPNLWSFIDNTPKGVTIHYIDAGLDTGDIILQKKILFKQSGETLSTTYGNLQVAVQELFKKNWESIRSETCPRDKQVGEGTYHRSRDKNILSETLLKDGWDTPVSILENYGEETRMSNRFWEKYDSEIEEIRNDKQDDNTI